MLDDALGIELRALNGLDRDELLKRWRSLYEREPPVSISRSLLLHAIAYRMQEKALGGLKSSTQRLLAQATNGNIIPAAVAKAGMRLLREWHGVTYEVAVVEDGVLYKGKKYQSLSEVARTITGTKWSGPLFFGLRKKTHG